MADVAPILKADNAPAPQLDGVDAAPVPQSETTEAPAPIRTSSQSKPRGVSLAKLYALPAPLRTFPLPTLVPHNPISLFHLLFVWFSQTIRPQSTHPETSYQGLWSVETRSVHVTESRSIRGLWEQGFYGKGSLSRSEPEWLNREKTRRGGKSKATSGELTRQRRAERQQTKWERARKEREAIDQKLQEEAEASLVREIESHADSASTEQEVVIESDTGLTQSEGDGETLAKEFKLFRSPIGPLELLSLPNSSLDLEHYTSDGSWTSEESISTLPVTIFLKQSYAAPIGPLEILALPNSQGDLFVRGITPADGHVQQVEALEYTNSNALLKMEDYSIPDSKVNVDNIQNNLVSNGHSKTAEPCLNGGSNLNDEAISGSVQSDDTVQTSSFTPNGSALANGTPGTPKMKRRKSVRFSPTVEKNTFIQNEPPSPEKAITTAETVEVAPEKVEEEHIVVQEHFQLTLEEAFFLTYALGALTIFDPMTRSPIPNEELFTLFRKSSYFPPRANHSLAPDDPFMLNYVVYHHFRSLGWVVRAGTKFSVDFMLYNRGPPFSHAEFAVVILPSYSDPYWTGDVFMRNYVKGKEKRTWAWLHCINRVISQVKKTLILVYVDIPKPLDDGMEKELGVDGILGRYKVREVAVTRWQANRSRD